MFEIVIVIVLALFAAGGIWAFVVSKKVKSEGIVTDAEVTRVEIQEWSGGAEAWDHGNYTKDYYISYTNQEGEVVEALLSNPGDREFEEGDRLKIKYLPDRQEYPVMVE